MTMERPKLEGLGKKFKKPIAYRQTRTIYICMKEFVYKYSIIYTRINIYLIIVYHYFLYTLLIYN